MRAFVDDYDTVISLHALAESEQLQHTVGVQLWLVRQLALHGLFLGLVGC